MGNSVKDLWLGRIEILTPPTDFGDTKAFTKVVARANTEIDFREHVSLTCEEYDWSLISVEDCNPLSKVIGITDEELLDAIERAKDYPEACIFTTLHYYPSKPS
jgi:hypothetical protein